MHPSVRTSAGSRTPVPAETGSPSRRDPVTPSIPPPPSAHYSQALTIYYSNPRGYRTLSYTQTRQKYDLLSSGMTDSEGRFSDPYPSI
jgi:hypothetical protein